MPDKTKFSSATDIEILSRETSLDSFLQVDALVLKHRLFEGGWSEPLSRELLVKTPAVGVLLHDPDQSQFVMIKQFRVGMFDSEESPWPLELVAGLIDKDESPKEVALREIEEETGLQANGLTRICEYYNSPGASTERVTLFFAQVDAKKAGGVHGLDNENEDILVQVLSESEVKEAINSGLINNAMSLIALQWFFLQRESENSN